MAVFLRCFCLSNSPFRSLYLFYIIFLFYSLQECFYFSYVCICHDGKRDFVYPKEESFPDQKWAECKNYSNNLSLNIIAPTLIMGAIENIESIFIFSYSSLNDNAIEGILNYSKTSKRKVELFDGNVLESLICKFHNINGIQIKYFVIITNSKMI